MSIQLLRQPEGSKLCGQTCVAMLAGVSLEESIQVFGSRSGTCTKQVAAALRKFGIKCRDKLTRITKGIKLPDVCIVKLHFDGTKDTHWTVWHHGIFYDPDYGITDKSEHRSRETNDFNRYVTIRQTGDPDRGRCGAMDGRKVFIAEAAIKT